MIVRFLTPARSEVREIIAYYNNRRAGLGDEFAAELKQTLNRIKHYPEAWSPLSSQFRRCHLNRFPFSVIYEVQTGDIVIAAVQHHSQEPNSWRKRLH